MSDYYSDYQPYQPQYLRGQATVQPQQLTSPYAQSPLQRRSIMQTLFRNRTSTSPRSSRPPAGCFTVAAVNSLQT